MARHALSGCESGQSTVELALCLPIVAILLGIFVQVGIVIVDNARLWHAAREAARTAAVTDDLSEIRAAAEAAGVGPIEVTIDPVSTDRALGAPVRVRVSHRPSLRLPLVEGVVEMPELRAEATMRIETP